MKSKLNQLIAAVSLLALAVLNFPLSSASAQGTSAFTYQGWLNSGANAANGSYDLTFAVSDASVAGNQIAGPITNSAVAVSNGLFQVVLDFGDVFNGSNYWLQMAVRTNGNGPFTILIPAQPVLPMPYAIYSANAGSAALATLAVTASSMAATNISGVIPLAELPVNLLTNGSSGVTLSGTISGNGSGVLNVNLLNINSQGAISWTTNGYGNLWTPSVLVVSNGSYFGVLPNSVVTFTNVDGYVDLACANKDGNVSVFTNNGSGGYTLSANLPDGWLPCSITTADVNGDGKMDLICANYGANNVSIFTNNGIGGFVLSSSPSVGYYPDSVTAADVNGDGLVDIICACFTGTGNGNTLTVLTNNGSGGFAIASSPVVGTFGVDPQSVTTADVNGDGKVDLICVNGNANTLTVLTNSGTASFAISGIYTVGNNPYSVAAADVNGDGKPDLISANKNDGTLTVLTNNGSGGLVVAATLKVGSDPDSVIAADVNGDGRVDLVSANGNTNTLTILTNNGSGGFVFSTTLNAGQYPSSVAAADVNGDGHVDLVGANYGDNTITELINTPNITAYFTGNAGGLVNVKASSIVGGVTTNIVLSGHTLYYTNGVLMNFQ